MSVRVTVDQLKEQLTQLLDQTVASGEECVVQRDGEEYAVIIGAREWRKRQAQGEPAEPGLTPRQRARFRDIGRRLDALGPAYRLSHEKQQRVKELLEQAKDGPLARAEQDELNALLEESDQVMLQRAEALDQIL
jgi:prevent-host-death family protein